MPHDIPESFGDWNQRTTAAQWAPETVVEFFNVPWTSDYRDVVDFDDQDALDTYLDQKVSEIYRLDRMVHLRPYEPIRLNIPFNMAMQFNYIRVQNPQQPVWWEAGDGETRRDVPRSFYYFVNDLRYVAPNTTELQVQVDVWCTYKHTVTAGYGYVERGHVGVANSNDMWEYGRRYLTVPEGLDMGNEYSIAATRREKVADESDFGIIVWSTVELSVAGTETDGSPRLITAGGSAFGHVPNGASAYYLPNRSSLQSWLAAHASEPWKTQGIIAIQAVPPLERYGYQFHSESTPDEHGMRPLIGGRPGNRVLQLFPNWRDQVELPERYRHLNKFYTYPYCVLELTTNTGSPVVLKPEQWDRDCQVNELPHLAQPGPRLVFTPIYYNMRNGANVPDGHHDGAEFLDISTGIYDFPTFSVVNNGYLSFMASNRNQIQYQNQAADWSQQKALQGAQTGYDQATMNAQTQQGLNNVQIGQMNASTNLANQMGASRVGINAVQGLAQGAMFGGGAGLALGAANAGTSAIGEVLNHNERNAQNAINTGASRDSQRLAQQNMSYQRDSNMDLARFAAKGDYANAIAGINAKTQDARLTQPTTSGQVGGEAFNLVSDQWGVDVKVKLVNSGAMRAIGEFWLRYGYAVNTFMRPYSFSVMSRFTYWKFQEFYIQSSLIPEVYKNAIRGIFEKGVTVWSSPDDIGQTDPGDNEPIKAAYY